MKATEIKSELTEIEKSADFVYQYLSDLNNFAHLMPDEVTNYEVTDQKASLNISGLGSLSIQITEQIPNRYLKLVPKGKLPFEFIINWNIQDFGSSCKVEALIEAKLNMFIKMMAVPKLTSFIESQVKALKVELEKKS